MTAKTKAPRKPVMKSYTLPKEDVEALAAYVAAHPVILVDSGPADTAGHVHYYRLQWVKVTAPLAKSCTTMAWRAESR